MEEFKENNPKYKYDIILSFGDADEYRRSVCVVILLVKSLNTPKSTIVLSYIKMEIFSSARSLEV